MTLPQRALPARSAAERRDALERLLAWARARGARWDGIEFRIAHDGSASAVAARSLAVGDEILTLPRSLMIIDDELALDLGFTAHPRDTLAAWLALEAAHPTSPWRAYLDSLPPELGALPMFHDLGALVGTAMHTLATDTSRDVIGMYDRLDPELRARLSLADFAWARGIVMSRAFKAPGSFDHRIALLPLVDIFNHGRDDAAWSYGPLEGLVVRMEHALESGDEVHFSYGDRSNTHLAVHYGFTLADNPDDEAELVFEPLDARLRVRVAAIFDERLDRALSLARLQACEPAECERILGSIVEPTTVPFLDAANEEAALDVLATVARRARGELDAYVAATPHDAWDQMCATVRAGERRVLDQLVDLALAARPFARAEAIAIPADAGLLLRRYLEDRQRSAIS